MVTFEGQEWSLLLLIIQRYPFCPITQPVKYGLTKTQGLK